MKTTKIFLKSEILFGILLMGVMALCFTACDTLKEDPDVITPTTEIKGKEVYVAANSASVIDLNAKISTNLPVTLSVTSPTTKGTLTSLGRGLLQYAPANRRANTRDAFEFTIYSQSHEVLGKDTIVIIVETDSTKLPCGLYPADDYVTNFQGDSTITIDVLANDHLCGIDSLDYQLSIYREGSNAGPQHGTATVVKNRITYTAGPSYTNSDMFIYKIQSRRDLTKIAYGYVYLKASVATTPCPLILSDDFFQINPDTLAADTVLLRVFANDVLCDTLDASYTMNIAKAPVYGQARIGPLGITYTPDNLPVGTKRTDSLRYEFCRSATCRQAKVIITLAR